MSLTIDTQSPTPNDREEWEYIWTRYHEWAIPEWMDTLWCRLENPEKMWGVIGLLIKCNGYVIWILHMQIKWWTFSQNPTLYIEDLCIHYPRLFLKEMKWEKEEFKNLLRSSLISAVQKIVASVKNILGGVEIKTIEFDTDTENHLARRMYREIAWDGHQKDWRIYYSVEPEYIRE